MGMGMCHVLVCTPEPRNSDKSGVGGRKKAPTLLKTSSANYRREEARGKGGQIRGEGWEVQLPPGPLPCPPACLVRPLAIQLAHPPCLVCLCTCKIHQGLGDAHLSARSMIVNCPACGGPACTTGTFMKKSDQSCYRVWK